MASLPSLTYAELKRQVDLVQPMRSGSYARPMFLSFSSRTGDTNPRDLALQMRLKLQEIEPKFPLELCFVDRASISMGLVASEMYLAAMYSHLFVILWTSGEHGYLSSTVAVREFTARCPVVGQSKVNFQQDDDKAKVRDLLEDPIDLLRPAELRDLTPHSRVLIVFDSSLTNQNTITQAFLASTDASSTFEQLRHQNDISFLPVCRLWSDVSADSKSLEKCTKDVYNAYLKHVPRSKVTGYAHAKRLQKRAGRVIVHGDGRVFKYLRDQLKQCQTTVGAVDTVLVDINWTGDWSQLFDDVKTDDEEKTKQEHEAAAKPRPSSMFSPPSEAELATSTSSGSSFSGLVGNDVYIPRMRLVPLWVGDFHLNSGCAAARNFQGLTLLNEMFQHSLLPALLHKRLELEFEEFACQTCQTKCDSLDSLHQHCLQCIRL